MYGVKNLYDLLQAVERLSREVEQQRGQVEGALAATAAAEGAREAAEKAAAASAAELFEAQLQLQSLRAAQAHAASEADSFEQRLAKAVAGKHSSYAKCC